MHLKSMHFHNGDGTNTVVTAVTT